LNSAASLNPHKQCIGWCHAGPANLDHVQSILVVFRLESDGFA
jgi:hypothetical protein